MISYEQLLKDIESLKGKRLESIKSGADLVVDDVDYDNEKVYVHAPDKPSERDGRPFREFKDIWKMMETACLTNNPWVEVETALRGNGSKRNRPETIIANLSYIVWDRPNKHKCIAYTGQESHVSGEIKKADDSDLMAIKKVRKEEYASRLSSKPRNWIFFGAPGTGKSHQLKKLADSSFIEENISRVTFYPDYTYSQFVGSFKPVTKYQYVSDSEKSAKENESKVADDDASAPQNEAGEHMEAYISYEFVPGPFLDVYIKAVQNPKENYLLIVEEINRAKPAAVFGDVFQLLDRDDNGRSVYEVAVPREMHDHLRIFLPEYATIDHIKDREKLLSEQVRLKNEANRLSLPGNMYIWATMNSADQGVFPMDTAFKRRWDFRYMGIDEGETADIDGTPLNEITVPCGERNIVWNDLRHAINEFMASEYLKINEDKLLGPFFINPQVLVHTPEHFGEVFKDKVLLYLYEDAGKTKRPKMFKKELNTYSKICEEFDKHGAGIFGEGFDSSGLADTADDADANPVEV